MRKAAFLLLAVVPLLVGAAPPPAKPQRIMSMMMCNDLMLLMLVPKERIASITYLAHDAVKTLMPGADAGIAINHGTAEEILLHKPDLIVAGDFSAPIARRLAKKVGAQMIEVASADSFEQIRAMTRQIGAAVGEPARAEALIAGMDRDLAELARTRPARTLRVVAWTTGGKVPGHGTLTDEIIRAAGATNIAASLPDARYGSYSMEELLQAKPDAIMQGDDRYGAPSLSRMMVGHPLLKTVYRDRHISYPGALYTCGLPQSADAVRRLRAALQAVPKGSAW
jgi:iron complex transport system substrate-binding protein